MKYARRHQTDVSGLFCLGAGMAGLDAVVRDSLIKQVNIERFNEAVYLALAWRLDVLNLSGAAKYFKAQADEEAQHARKFADYLIDRNESPVVSSVMGFDAPAADMLTAIATFAQAALQREMINTEYIKTIYAQAQEADDPQTCVWLIWALDEQTHAERELSELVARAVFAQGCPAAILALDKELGA